MVAKFALVALLAAAAAAVPLAPIAKLVEAEAPAHYEFSYSVHDPHTGDVKEQQESRSGDAVQGHYSLLEADGTRRIVHYTADAHNGFNAQVTHEGHPQPTKVAKVLAAPAHHVTYAAPAHHLVAAPAHHVTYAAPSHHVVAAPAHHVTYAAPAHHVAVAAPAHHVTYAAPAHHVALAAPVAKLAAAPLAQVSFASPVYSYHH